MIIRARKNTKLESFVTGDTQKRISLPAPHALQAKILDAVKRYTFVVILCGRRFGKTFLLAGTSPCLLDDAIYGGCNAGVFTPVSADAAPLLLNLKSNFSKLVTREDNTRRSYQYRDDGMINFFSLPNSGKRDSARGGNYKLTIYDEFQKLAPEIAAYHVSKVAQPWMSDTPGSQMFFVGTANGIGTYFHELAKKGAANGIKEGLIYNNDIDDLKDEETGQLLTGHDRYLTIRMPSEANPHLDAAALQMLREEMTTLDAAQEIDCNFVLIGGKIWCWAIADAQTQKRIFAPVKLDWRGEIILSLDFNKTPMSGVAVQLTPKRGAHPMWLSGLSVCKEFTTPAGEKSSIYDLARVVRQYIYEQTGRKVGNWEGVMHPNPFHIWVTGDATGNHGDGRQKTSKSYFKIFADELGLNYRTQCRILNINPTHFESHVQVNTLIEKNDQFFINRGECPLLVKDMFSAVADPYRGIDKKAYDPHKLDAFRYVPNTFRERITRTFRS